MATKTAIFAAILTLALTVPAGAATPPAEPLLAEVTQLTNEITASQLELQALDNKLESTTKEILRIYQQLDAEEAYLNQQKKVLNARIQQVYKNYDEMLLSIFIDARSFNDIWRRMAFLAKVNQADRQLLTANKIRLERVRALKRQLAAKKQQQVDLKQEQQTQFASLQQAFAQKKAELEEKLRQVRANQAAIAGNEATGTFLVDFRADKR